jgi:hypothetical protein
MSDYQALFDIRITHEYFVTGACPCLDFIPTDNTRRLLRNCGLLMKKHKQGLGLAFDRESQDALQLQLAEDSEGLDLVFKLYASDPQFRTYTEPFAESMQGLFYFTNRGLPAAEPAKLKLHAGAAVSSRDWIDLEAERLRGILDSRDRLCPPVGVIRLYADEQSYPLFDKHNKPKSPCFTIHWKARQTFWKYYLQSEKPGEDVYVFDPEGRIEFESTGPDRLANGKTVSTYRSKQRIPLNQRFDFRFQLKQRKHGVEKILYRQLPFARVSQTGKEVVAQQAIAVSEIYINY